MSDRSKIEWTDATWNPVTGCSKVGTGCLNCYAERTAKRFAGRFGYPAGKPFQVTLHEDRLEQPLHWRKPRRIFVCSMSDLFHEQVPFDFIDKVFAVMALCPQHTFLVLTKRKRMVEYYSRGNCEHYPRETDVHIAMESYGWTSREDILTYAPPGSIVPYDPKWPLPNVQLGTTVENQDHVSRIDGLMKCPAAMRFVSIEPMLGPVDLRLCPAPDDVLACDRDPNNELEDSPVAGMECRSGKHWVNCTRFDHRNCLDWVIVGCESGPRARPMDPDWVRSIRNQCMAAGVSFYLKQMMVNGKLVKLPKLDGRQWTEMPDR